MKDAALSLRNIIKIAFQKSSELPWPPTASELYRRADTLLPEELDKFLTFVLSGDRDSDADAKTKRLVLSIGQDLCRAVTDGEWKLPKHILLCATVRHLYRSSKLTSILHRLGHCESYKFGLELETAMAKAIYHHRG